MERLVDHNSREGVITIPTQIRVKFNPVILIVVAHPDDEILWFGGGVRILLGSGIPIGIMSLTNKGNANRKVEFENACSKMGAVPLMADLPDGGRQIWKEPTNAIDEALNNAGIQIGNLSLLVTHSPFGNERQHPQHILVSNVIMKWALEHNLDTAFFSDFLLTSNFCNSDKRMDGLDVQCQFSKFSLMSFAKNFPKIVIKQKGNFIVTVLNLTKLFSKLRIYRNLENYDQVCRFEVDLNWKNEILKCYVSQIEGLQKYTAYSQKYDYLYIKSSSISKLSLQILNI